MSAWLILLFALAVADPEPIKVPAAIPREKGSNVVTDKSGNVRWTAEWTMEPFREQGQNAVRFTETGMGRYAPFRQDVRWSAEAIWSAQDVFSPIRVEKKFTDASGHTIQTERKTIDQAKSVALFERTSAVGKPLTRSLQITRATLVGEGIAGILQFLPFEQWHPFTSELLSNEPEVYNVKIELRGKERIKTPAGVFECYKIELVPQLGLLNILRSLAPKIYFWFSVSSPHVWVRYEGPESTPGSPHVVMELKSYEIGR